MSARRVLVALVVLLFAATSAFASQPLETETARLLPKGMIKVEVVGEFQHSHDGTERAFPVVFEYGITDTTELTVEPVFGTSIHPKSGTRASGFGDTEITLTQLLLRESGNAPALAVAGEVKLPTAGNRQIGTGKTDFTVWGIVSKRLGRVDLHGNLGYTIIGSPSGTHLKNIIDYAIAEEFHLSPKVDIVGEIIGNTSSTGEGTEGSTPTFGVPPEAAGAETSALLGFRYKVSPALALALGMSYDNNHAWLLRTGVTYRFGAR